MKVEPMRFRPTRVGMFLLLLCVSAWPQAMWTALLQAESVKYVVVGQRSTTYVTNASQITLRKELREIFRIVDTNTIARLVEAIRLRPKKPLGGEFCGDFLAQCFVGAHDEVLLDVVILENRQISWGLTSTLCDGQVVYGRMNEMYGENGLYPDYYAIIYSEFTNREPRMAADWEKRRIMEAPSTPKSDRSAGSDRRAP